VTKIISLVVFNFVTPKAGAKHEPLFNEPASGNKRQRKKIKCFFSPRPKTPPKEEKKAVVKAAKAAAVKKEKKITFEKKINDPRSGEPVSRNQ
jgi:hypothetical protein